MRKSRVTVDKDEFSGTQTKKLNLATSSFKPISESSIGLIQSEQGVILYSFLYKNDWLFVESISIKIDGSIYTLESLKERREVESGSYISEKNWYEPSSELVEAFKSAKEISYRLTGKSYFIDFEVKSKKLALIEDFFSN